MREIKFRAWDKRHCEMYQPCYVEIFKDGSYCACPDNKNNYANNIYAIMQYIGLKDKNGKEIYEGDIVLSQRYSTRPYSKSAKHKRFKMLVEYRINEMGSAEWCAKEIEKIGNYGYGSWGDFFDCEIIGNKFENPGLLKQIEGE